MTKPECPCRLCSGNTINKFNLRVLERFEVRYFECAYCGSLQTEEPHWLKEAYEHSNLAYSDVGAAQRVLVTASLVGLFAKWMGLHSILDFGGGDGLLCRLLRDRGLEAYTIDKFSVPSYAQPFVGSLEKNYDLLTAFEVFEHFPNPRESLDQLFQCQPRFLLASSELYRGNQSDWWYLAPKSGQHVFFYSEGALRWIAARYDYCYHSLNGWHLFAKTKPSRLQLSVLSRLTGKTIFKLYRASLPFSETWAWIERDHETSLKGVR
jgi:2-polyprenyl-3-methyl-5-hydroxy-6-metoxy-1,4-benzoquinol methylase